MSKRDEAIKSAIEAMDTTFGPGKAGYGRAAAAMTVCADRANRADRGSEEREGMADVDRRAARRGRLRCGDGRRQLGVGKQPRESDHEGLRDESRGSSDPATPTEG